MHDHSSAIGIIVIIIALLFVVLADLLHRGEPDDGPLAVARGKPGEADVSERPPLAVVRRSA